jgi:hypothetical protein
LAFQYSNEAVNNLKTLAGNFSVFRQHAFPNEEIPNDSPLSQNFKRLEQNYIPGLILLYQVANSSGDHQTANQYRQKAESIARRQGQLKQLTTYLDKE